MLACTGLVILYTQPLDLWLNHDLKVVPQGISDVSLDDQVVAARQHVGSDMELDAVTPPDSPDRSTQVDFLPAEVPEVGERNVTQVFVDPYTGRYLGQRHELDGLVGWANQLHRLFGNDGPTVALPSVGHLIAPSAYPDAWLEGRCRQPHHRDHRGMDPGTAGQWHLPVVAARNRARQAEIGSPVAKGRTDPLARCTCHRPAFCFSRADLLHRFRTDVVAVLG